jgi:hypothetical protein
LIDPQGGLRQARRRLCWNHWQLMCPSTIIGWFDVAILAGGVTLLLVGGGVKKRYGVVIVVLLALI